MMSKILLGILLLTQLSAAFAELPKTLSNQIIINQYQAELDRLYQLKNHNKDKKFDKLANKSKKKFKKNIIKAKKMAQNAFKIKSKGILANWGKVAEAEKLKDIQVRDHITSINEKTGLAHLKWYKFRQRKELKEFIKMAKESKRIWTEKEEEVPGQTIDKLFNDLNTNKVYNISLIEEYKKFSIQNMKNGNTPPSFEDYLVSLVFNISDQRETFSLNFTGKNKNEILAQIEELKDVIYRQEYKSDKIRMHNKVRLYIKELAEELMSYYNSLLKVPDQICDNGNQVDGRLNFTGDLIRSIEEQKRSDLKKARRKNKSIMKYGYFVKPLDSKDTTTMDAILDGTSMEKVLAKEDVDTMTEQMKHLSKNIKATLVTMNDSSQNSKTYANIEFIIRVAKDAKVRLEQFRQSLVSYRDSFRQKIRMIRPSERRRIKAAETNITELEAQLDQLNKLISKIAA